MLNAREYGLNAVRGSPLVLQYVQAYAAVLVYVGMEHLCDELDLWWFIGVRVRELKFELERGTFPVCLGRAHYDRSPAHDVVFVWHRKYGVADSVLLYFLEILNQAPLGVVRSCHFQLLN